jgi:hypothetical protein
LLRDREPNKEWLRDGEPNKECIASKLKMRTGASAPWR